jgi:predicted SAM-dependent methyltransferase
MRLNLGCSSDIRTGGQWVNVDLVQPCDQVVDLSLRWPWPTSSIEEIYAADIFEHLPDRINTMNEAHRVLKAGGRLTIECPDAAKGAGQWQDPTHVSAWTPNGLQYFADGSRAHKRFAVAYGITARFNVLSVTERQYSEMAGACRCEVWKFHAILEAVK